jgi:hypothetical protein
MPDALLVSSSAGLDNKRRWKLTTGVAESKDVNRKSALRKFIHRRWGWCSSSSSRARSLRSSDVWELTHHLNQLREREPSRLERPEDPRPRRRAKKHAPTPGDPGQLNLTLQKKHKIREADKIP